MMEGWKEEHFRNWQMQSRKLWQMTKIPRKKKAIGKDRGC
jgi:hypothetical protein